MTDQEDSHAVIAFLSVEQIAQMLELPKGSKIVGADFSRDENAEEYGLGWLKLKIMHLANPQDMRLRSFAKTAD